MQMPETEEEWEDNGAAYEAKLEAREKRESELHDKYWRMFEDHWVLVFDAPNERHRVVVWFESREALQDYLEENCAAGKGLLELDYAGPPMMGEKWVELTLKFESLSEAERKTTLRERPKKPYWSRAGHSALIVPVQHIQQYQSFSWSGYLIDIENDDQETSYHLPVED